MDWIEFLLLSLASVFQVAGFRHRQQAARESAIEQGPAAVAALEARVDRRAMARDPRVRSGGRCLFLGLVAIALWVGAVYAAAGPADSLSKRVQQIIMWAVAGLPVASTILIVIGFRRMDKGLAQLRTEAVAAAVEAAEQGETAGSGRRQVNG